MKNSENYISSVLDSLSIYHSYHVNFHNAVEEVFTDVKPFIEANPDVQKFKLLERLVEADRIIRFRVCWTDDKGQIQVNRGWRVQHSNVLGPYKGGIRFHETVDEDTLKFLAFEQCFKNSLTGMSLGGAKGGSDFNPKGRSNAEIMSFCHSFMDELQKHIGENVDIPAGDIGVGQKEIGFLFGRYLKIKSHFVGTLTGKDPGYGGSCGRAEATGYGIIYFLKNIFDENNIDIDGKSVVISGAGNVAIYTAEKALESNMKVLSLSDSKGSAYFENGLTKEQLDRYVEAQNKGMRLKEWCDKNSEIYKDGKKPWSIKADVYLPCATQNEINEEDAKEILKNSPLAIVEGANMPLTDKASKIVQEYEDVFYAPGKASNAGGVAVSNLERAQNATLTSWDKKTVTKKLEKIMKNIHQNCISIDGEFTKASRYKEGANIYSFKRLVNALLAYGNY